MSISAPCNPAARGPAPAPDGDTVAAADAGTAAGAIIDAAARAGSKARGAFAAAAGADTFRACPGTCASAADSTGVTHVAAMGAGGGGG